MAGVSFHLMPVSLTDSLMGFTSPRPNIVSTLPGLRVCSAGLIFNVFPSSFQGVTDSKPEKAYGESGENK